MGLGICIIGVAIILGISYNSERIYVIYCPPGFLAFLIGQWLTRKK